MPSANILTYDDRKLLEITRDLPKAYENNPELVDNYDIKLVLAQS